MTKLTPNQRARVNGRRGSVTLEREPAESNEMRQTRAFYSRMLARLEDQFERGLISTAQFRAEVREVELAEAASLRNMRR